MFANRKVNSQSGFMSVESIANTLFYLIMVAVVTMIAATVMKSGKTSTSISALSMLRANVQYVGTNVGSFEDIDGVNPAALVPGLIKTDGAATPVFSLPTGEVLAVAVADATHVDPVTGAALDAAADPNELFSMTITAASAENCRKFAYYGIGAGYGVMIAAAAIPPATAVTAIEGACVTPAGDNVILTSR